MRSRLLLLTFHIMMVPSPLLHWVRERGVALAALGIPQRDGSVFARGGDCAIIG